jgi:hypothetical protein
MTTLDDPNAIPGAARVTRPDPGRTQPIRSAVEPSPAAAEPAAPVAHAAAAEWDDTVSESVAHAVRAGYDVVAANIKEGRLAAKRFRQGDYTVRDVPRDLNTMTLRLVHLARDLSATTFDVLEQLLKDPNLAGAGSHVREGAPVVRPVAPVAPGFHPAPGPAVKASAQAPAPHHVHPATPAPATVALTCAFTGGRGARMTGAAVSRPVRPTHPDQLAMTPMTAVTPGAKAIGGVTFTAAGGGAGLIAHIEIPDDQAPGVYSGLIFAPSADAPLGFVSIEVPDVQPAAIKAPDTAAPDVDGLGEAAG